MTYRDSEKCEAPCVDAFPKRSRVVPASEWVLREDEESKEARRSSRRAEGARASR